MISASERGRPAVEAIDDALIRRFGHVVEANAVKQRIGRLVRPVMEARGFVPVRSRCPAKSPLFTSGTVYGSNRPIMAVLGKHGLEFDADDVSREIQSAIEMVGGNRPLPSGLLDSLGRTAATSPWQRPRARSPSLATR